jgi:uncharacterized membrane protein YhhN
VTDAIWYAFAAAAAFAVLDWIAVVRRNKPLEYVAKPAVMVALIVAAIFLQPELEVRRWAFVVALVFSMAGDVFLMLPANLFVRGVASFFVAHVAYIVGLRVGDHSVPALLIAALAVAVFAAIVGRRILVAVRESEPRFATPIAAYIAVICVMVASALAAREPLAAAGALLFMASDTLIAWNRFVQPLAWAPLTIIVTYHVGQALLVASLVD